jgi:ribosomal-protein-alanine N-acetyltransferase
MSERIGEVVYRKLSGGYFVGPVTPDDKVAYMEHLNERCIYDVTLTIPFPFTEADADWWIARRVTPPLKGKRTLFAIRNADGYMVGAVDAGMADEVDGVRTTEIGYWLAVPYWGKGLMTEVVTWLCEYAFAELEVSRVTAHVFSFNRGSARVLEKVGFRCEGLMKKLYLKDGIHIDAYRYVLEAESGS